MKKLVLKFIANLSDFISDNIPFLLFLFVAIHGVFALNFDTDYADTVYQYFLMSATINSPLVVSLALISFSYKFRPSFSNKVSSYSLLGQNLYNLYAMHFFSEDEYYYYSYIFNCALLLPLLVILAYFYFDNGEHRGRKKTN